MLCLFGRAHQAESGGQEEPDQVLGRLQRLAGQGSLSALLPGGNAQQGWEDGRIQEGAVLPCVELQCIFLMQTSAVAEQL